MKLIILDRDGTINVEREDFVKSADEWVPLPGALEAIARLNQAGWHTVIATNQSGIGRGLFDMADLNAMHLKLNQLLQNVGGRIDAVFFCPHTAQDGCACRKPLPGLLTQIGTRYGVDLKQVPMVGDSLRDLQAAVAAGCRPHLVRGGKAGSLDDATLAQWLLHAPDAQVHADLADFAEAMVRQERDARGKSGHVDSGYGHME